MLNRAFRLFALSSIALFAADENPYPPGVYKSASELMATLAKSEPRAGMSTSPIANQGHYRINVVKRTTPGPAGAHSSGPAKGSELHYIIDGAATVVTGGKLVREPGTANAQTGRIEGGETRHVSKGDVIVIPEGTPHWYKEVEGSVTYLEVRFDVQLDK